MPHINDLPTIFRLNGKEMFRADGLLPLANGTGVTTGEANHYKVVGSWLQVEHHGDNEEGLYIDLEVT